MSPKSSTDHDATWRRGPERPSGAARTLSRCQRIDHLSRGCALFTYVCALFHILALRRGDRRRIGTPVIRLHCRADPPGRRRPVREQRVVRGHSAGGHWLRRGFGGHPARRFPGSDRGSGPRPGWRPRPADDVSIAVSQLFGGTARISNRERPRFMPSSYALNRGAAAQHQR